MGQENDCSIFLHIPYSRRTEKTVYSPHQTEEEKK